MDDFFGDPSDCFCQDALDSHFSEVDAFSDQLGSFIDNGFGFGDDPTASSFGDVVDSGIDAYASAAAVSMHVATAQARQIRADHQAIRVDQMAVATLVSNRQYRPSNAYAPGG